MTKRTTYLGIMAALCFLMLALVPVSAESVVVKGNPAPSFTFTVAAGEITLPLSIGSNEKLDGNLVTATSNTGFSIKMKDAMANDAPTVCPTSQGKMKALNAAGAAHTGGFLTNALQVSLNGVWTPLTDADQTIHSSAVGASFSSPLKLKQVVSAADPSLSGGAVYDIQITITGSATP